MLTVAVTGPTGEIGKPFLAALERSDRVERILGMARRSFDPAEHGWEKVEYRQGPRSRRSCPGPWPARTRAPTSFAPASSPGRMRRF